MISGGRSLGSWLGRSVGGIGLLWPVWKGLNVSFWLLVASLGDLCIDGRGGCDVPGLLLGVEVCTSPLTL